jgi:heme/copper-type cytochrome/quinol oxidase subunit 4
MTESKKDDGSPKFGRLLIVLILAVLFCVGLTWVMARFFPNFPS